MNNEQPWFVYMVRCADDSLYTGITPDVGKRVILHNLGRAAKYTRGRGPVTLVYSEVYESKSLAACREVEIKRLAKGEKETLIKLMTDY